MMLQTSGPCVFVSSIMNRIKVYMKDIWFTWYLYMFYLENRLEINLHHGHEYLGVALIILNWYHTNGKQSHDAGLTQTIWWHSELRVKNHQHMLCMEGIQTHALKVSWTLHCLCLTSCNFFFIAKILGTRADFLIMCVYRSGAAFIVSYIW